MAELFLREITLFLHIFIYIWSVSLCVKSWSILHKERQKIVSFLRIFDVQFQFVCAVVFYYTSYHFQIYEVENPKTTGNTILWLSMVHLLVRVLFLYQHCVDPKHSLIEMITLIFDCIIKLTIISYYGMETTILGNNPEERFFFLRLIVIVISTGYISSSLCVTLQVREDVRAMMKTAEKIRCYTITTKFLSIIILSVILSNNYTSSSSRDYFSNCISKSTEKDENAHDFVYCNRKETIFVAAYSTIINFECAFEISQKMKVLHDAEVRELEKRDIMEQNRIGHLSAATIWVIVGGTVVVFFGVVVWAFFLANMKLWHRRWINHRILLQNKAAKRRHARKQKEVILAFQNNDKLEDSSSSDRRITLPKTPRMSPKSEFSDRSVDMMLKESELHRAV
ncbi:Oidioi.mRNA.OKI2018_I69.PAR.g9196.t1.cds [Oikopleura dioica]|uniref:Oidioi.mRNA.OKI2018_I69.PAR.g9196.t1.cds n=1 Tax=Oikopleura dioica TaxID=34765 RepID=A0ABN7RJI8_OIKDI|nr:Oidioi.mRNA.OKI2018_I69.PAR.g9196.t1.cds [Oikopleura dioica]